MSNQTEIQQKAEALLELPFTLGKFPVPVEEIATYLGFECHLFKPNVQTKEISGAVNHQLKKIFINANDSVRRQFFTLAHEIGHIILHDQQQDYIDYRHNSIGNPKEVEANYFAANLLMPEHMFRTQWEKCRKDFPSLVRFFGVSLSALTTRAYSLNLIE